MILDDDSSELDSRRLAEQLAQLRASQEKLFARMQQGEQHFRGLARSVWRVQEDERRRLARDLHDGLGQSLTALRHRIEQALHGEDPRAALNEALSVCDMAIGETRALSLNLRPQILDDLGLEAALAWLTRSAGEGPQITLDAGGLGELDDIELRTLVFRVAQEAINNALKHAGASTIALRCFVRAGGLHLLVVDDGRGCEVDAALAAGSQGASTGLSSMRERVRLFGGSFHFHSEPGEGAQVRVHLPLLGALAQAQGRQP